jgi:F-type H+-transporting ATPase subunit a
MEFRVFGDPVVFHLGAVPVTETMLAALGVSFSLVAAALVFRQAVLNRPDSIRAALAKLTVAWLDATVTEIVGRPDPIVTAISGALFIFIAACNLSGQLPGVHPATASLSTTSALAVIVFLAVPVIGVRARGVRGYVKHYFRPNPILFPLHLVSEVSRTVALAMRLFGNIMSGHLVVGLLVALAGFLVPMPFMVLDLLIGLLQAYIFAVLSTVFMGAALGAGEEE